MANEEIQQYVFKTAFTVRGFEAKSISAEQRDGWELISQKDASFLRSELSFRRPKPKPWWHILGPKFIAPIDRILANPRLKICAVLAFLVLLGGVIVVNLIAENARDVTALPAATTTPRAAVAEPAIIEPAPTPTVTPSIAATQVSDAEVVEVFETYIARREAEGVVIARTVTDVSFKGRILRVTFDPAAGGLDQAVFDVAIGPWSGNLAGFLASEIAFNDEVGNRLRPAIDRVETVHANGTALGTMTAAQILSLNDLEK